MSVRAFVAASTISLTVCIGARVSATTLTASANAGSWLIEASFMLRLAPVSAACFISLTSSGMAELRSANSFWRRISRTLDGARPISRAMASSAIPRAIMVIAAWNASCVVSRRPLSWFMAALKLLARSTLLNFTTNAGKVLRRRAFAATTRWLPSTRALGSMITIGG